MYKRIVNNIVGKQPNTNTEVLHQLMKQPVKESKLDTPKFQNFVKNNYHQADLLFLPNDKNYKYLLVVVDISSRLIDAEQLKDKNSINIVKAFKKIYNRDILDNPISLLILIWLILIFVPSVILDNDNDVPFFNSLIPTLE